MGRRRPEPESENHERWLVSYADFITLLFAFFVVMYAISSVNEGKYRVLSETLSHTFKSAVHHELQPEGIGYPQQPDVAVAPPVAVPRAAGSAVPGAFESQPGTAHLQQVRQQLEAAFGDLMADGQLNLAVGDSWLEIELNNNLLFASGDAEPRLGSLPFLRQLAQILEKHPNTIRVEGFTDNVPINTAKFPSNWELSASRAAAVVNFLSMYGVAPQRMAAVGYGEHQPIMSNDTDAGRQRNRRVVLVVSAASELRHPVGGAQDPSLEPTVRAANAVLDSLQAQRDIPGPGARAPSIQRVPLEGGGLLFTRDPEPARASAGR